MVASRICCLALPRICRWKWWESWQDPEYVSIYFYILFYMRIRPNLLEWNYRLFTPAKKTYTYEVISPFFPTAPYSKVSPPIWRHQWCNASNDEVYDGSKYGMQGVRTDKDRCKGGAPTDDDLVGGTPVHHLIDGALGCCGHFVSTDTPHRGQSGEVTAILWHMCRYSIGNTVDVLQSVVALWFAGSHIDESISNTLAVFARSLRFAWRNRDHSGVAAHLFGGTLEKTATESISGITPFPGVSLDHAKRMLSSETIHPQK